MKYLVKDLKIPRTVPSYIVQFSIISDQLMNDPQKLAEALKLIYPLKIIYVENQSHD